MGSVVVVGSTDSRGADGVQTGLPQADRKQHVMGPVCLWRYSEPKQDALFLISAKQWKLGSRNEVLRTVKIYVKHFL